MNLFSAGIFVLLRCLPFALASLGGCLTPSAIIIGFDVDLQVVSVGPSGVLWSSRPEQISKTVPKPIELDRFGDTVYRGPMFKAGFGVANTSIGVSLANNSAGEICFRFDEARLSTNFQSTSVAVRGWPPVDADEERRVGWKQYWALRRATGKLPLPKTCLAPGEQRVENGVSVADMKEIFPSGMMFNVAHPENVPKLESNGIGNWVKLYLPIDVAGGRENLEFTMTARQSVARASYY